MVTDPAARLLELLSLLQRRPRWTGPELAAALAVTTRTVRRDVDRLRSLGYPVDAEPGPDGGYRLGIGRDLPPLLLDDDEAVAVSVALSLAAAGAAPDVAEAALAALAKIERMLPPRARRRARAVQASTDLLTRLPDAGAALTETLSGLAQAVEGHEVVRCGYVDREGQATARRLEPHRLVATNRRWYALAYDLDRDDWRVLRVDRMADLQLTGHRFEPRPHRNAARLVSEAISTAPYRHQATIRFDVDADTLARRIPPTVGAIDADGPSASVLRVGSDHLPAIAGHLVQLDLPFEVIDPPELRAHLLRLGRQLTRAHRKPGGIPGGSALPSR